MKPGFKLRDQLYASFKGDMLITDARVSASSAGTSFIIAFSTVDACHQCRHYYYDKDENPAWCTYECNAGYGKDMKKCGYPRLDDLIRTIESAPEKMKDFREVEEQNFKIRSAFARNGYPIEDFLVNPENYIISRVE